MPNDTSIRELSLDMKDIQWRVRELSEKKGITERSLGFRAELFPASIHAIWEGEARQVQLVTIARLCHALNCDPGDLFELVEQEQPSEEEPLG